MNATCASGFGLTIHRMSRRFCAELAISLGVSLAAVIIVASGAPTWPTRSAPSQQPQLIAIPPLSPHVAAFVPVRPLRAPPSPPMARPRRAPAALVTRQSPQPSRMAPLPPARPIDFVAPSASPTPDQASTSLGSKLIGSFADAIPFHQALAAKADAIGSKIAGLLPRFR
ncbi:MAG TPA: hypothetical protein VND97_09370 [Beijerinckiaceae bacterium]|nr:hypothetical protein [Beijerinckiaceae bacterium]